MLPTPNDLKRLHHLTRVFNLLQADINYITGLIKKLSEKDLECDITLSVHDQQQHDLNAEKSSNFQDIMGYFVSGYPPIPMIPAASLKPCKENFKFTCSESTTMVILTALLREKQDRHREVQQQLSDIYYRNYAQFHQATGNPILELHK